MASKIRIDIALENSSCPLFRTGEKIFMKCLTENKRKETEYKVPLINTEALNTWQLNLFPGIFQSNYIFKSSANNRFCTTKHNRLGRNAGDKHCRTILALKHYHFLFIKLGTWMAIWRLYSEGDGLAHETKHMPNLGISKFQKVIFVQACASWTLPGLRGFFPSVSSQIPPVTEVQFIVRIIVNIMWDNVSLRICWLTPGTNHQHPT